MEKSNVVLDQQSHNSKQVTCCMMTLLVTRSLAGFITICTASNSDIAARVSRLGPCTT